MTKRNDRDDLGDYEVGYGKPPRSTQFRKGTSGNPRGRPKGATNVESLFRRICNEKVKTNGPAGPQTMTKLEAALTQLVNKAASGDIKAIRELNRLSRQFPHFSEPLTPPTFHIHFVEPEKKE